MVGVGVDITITSLFDGESSPTYGVVQSHDHQDAGWFPYDHNWGPGGTTMMGRQEVHLVRGYHREPTLVPITCVGIRKGIRMSKCGYKPLRGVRKSQVLQLLSMWVVAR